MHIIFTMLKGISQVLFGGLYTRANELYKGKRPYSNSIRIGALLLGATIGILLSTMIFQDALVELVEGISGAAIGKITATALKITDLSVSIMVSSRVADIIAAKVMIPSYYFCRYRVFDEQYKPISDKELRKINDNLARQPGSTIKSIAEIQRIAEHNGYHDEEIDRIIQTKLSGVQALLQCMQQQIILYRRHTEHVKVLSIDDDWSLLRNGRIDDLCLGYGYVTNMLKERFDLPSSSNGRVRKDSALGRIAIEPRNTIEFGIMQFGAVSNAGEDPYIKLEIKMRPEDVHSLSKIGLFAKNPQSSSSISIMDENDEPLERILN